MDFSTGGSIIMDYGLVFWLETTVCGKITYRIKRTVHPKIEIG